MGDVVCVDKAAATNGIQVVLVRECSAEKDAVFFGRAVVGDTGEFFNRVFCHSSEYRELRFSALLG